MARNVRKRRPTAADRARRAHSTCLAFGNAKPDSQRNISVANNRQRIRDDRKEAYQARVTGYPHTMSLENRQRDDLPAYPATPAPVEAPKAEPKQRQPKAGEKIYPKQAKTANRSRKSNSGRGKPKTADGKK